MFKLKQIEAEIKEEFLNLQVFHMSIKDTEDATTVVESQKDRYNFDDLALQIQFLEKYRFQ